MSHEQASRERIVCDNCGLAFYADREGCPYCETAGIEPEAAVVDTEPATEETGNGLLGRLKQALGI
jgi:uncharacterized OB-fold protein